MNIHKSTSKYEAWLARRLRLIDADLEFKHRQMRAGAFPFLRATFYRWAQIWGEVCGRAARAPKVLAVGDLHVENFGTWRDGEGRLVWGINDFDEVWRIPYTNDLIRLATSALLAEMQCDPEAATGAMLEGYREALKAGGCPYVLAEDHPALHHMATARLHDPVPFWEKLAKLPECNTAMPASASKAVSRMLPERGLRWKTSHRIAGLGSLGRERYVCLTFWRGAWVAREAKALAPSACLWAERGEGTSEILYQKILSRAVRCGDPFVRLYKRWIVRRLAPDCSRIELSALPRERDEIRLLRSMGLETANVHLGTSSAKRLLTDLRSRPKGWLLKAAREMERAVRKDFEAYREQPKTR